MQLFIFCHFTYTQRALFSTYFGAVVAASDVLDAAATSTSMTPNPECCLFEWPCSPISRCWFWRTLFLARHVFEPQTDEFLQWRSDDDDDELWATQRTCAAFQREKERIEVELGKWGRRRNCWVLGQGGCEFAGARNTTAIRPRGLFCVNNK